MDKYTLLHKVHINYDLPSKFADLRCGKVQNFYFYTVYQINDNKRFLGLYMEISYQLSVYYIVLVFIENWLHLSQVFREYFSTIRGTLGGFTFSPNQ